RTLLFLGFCAGAGLMILNQDFQITGIAVLAAAAAVAVEAFARSAPREPLRRRPALAIAYLLLLALVVPTIVNRGLALGTHVAIASTSPPHRFALPRLGSIVLAENGWQSDAL